MAGWRYLDESRLLGSLMEGSVEESQGRVTIAPNVLVTIVQKTAAAAPGVAHLHESVPNVKRLLGFHTVGRGVEVRIVDDQVSVDVYLVARRGVDLLQMGRGLQHEITRAMQDILGKPVREVNVHVEDVAMEPAAES
jgi:uncharacterized alkaline shock family protein YloU